MSIDKEKLKALAEAAQNDSGDYAALNDYGMAVPPAVTLALLAEIERLSPPVGHVSYQEQMEAWKAASSQDLRARGDLLVQVEELEAKNEALRKSLHKINDSLWREHWSE